jgi:GNAT superfamily N-acetyltransferase
MRMQRYALFQGTRPWETALAGSALADGIEIRPLEAGDRGDWDRLWADYLAFYGTRRSPDVFDTTFARYLDPARADMLAFVAVAEGSCVGLAHVIVHAHGWQIAPVTYLQDLYADPSIRGKGIGRALIEAVYADADAAGRPNVYWTTQTGNTTARRLYDRIGVATDFMKYSRS